MEDREITVKKYKSIAQRVEEIQFWYHRIELPSGIVTPGTEPVHAAKYAIPDDLTGKRVLDIGAWDGYWTWEALKRGAKEVIAIDDFSDNIYTVNGANKDFPHRDWSGFDLCREALGFEEKRDETFKNMYWSNNKDQRVKRIEMSIYSIDAEEFNLGHFDIVFFFGTIYHLKHPMLALEKISAVCDDEIYIESAICDNYSPYRGGLGKGYKNNDMVTEFYPTDQYGDNDSNWWIPTLQCLGNMVNSAGFKGLRAWYLTTYPEHISECRGFVYGNKTGVINAGCDAMTRTEDERHKKRLSVAAIMSVPRLGFMDNLFCVMESLIPHNIPIQKIQGAFWGQCIERGIQTQIDIGADAILTIDYDTVFTAEDIGLLIKLMEEHPECDAIVPLQVGRSGMKGLLSLKTKSGQLMDRVPEPVLKQELAQICSGHFGLTLLRTSSLIKLPHPWFLDQPASDGQWGAGRIDADIGFWQKMERAGMKVFSANGVVLGHLELVVTWPDNALNPIHQAIPDYQKDHRPPADIWNINNTQK